MKIATFNIQNVYNRNKEFIQLSLSKCVTNWYKELDQLISKGGKVPRDLDRMKELSFLLGFEEVGINSYALLRRRGGQLFVRRLTTPSEERANDFNGWNGWIFVQTIPTNSKALENKARVIAEVNPDILLLQEVEDKSALSEFNREFLKENSLVPYENLLVLQGNDERGQELAFLSKNGYVVKSFHSYMGEKEDGEYLFEKNVIQYEVTSPSQVKVWIIAVHFTEMGKNKEQSDRKRFRQASRVAEIYQQLLDEGKDHVVVTGCFNAVSYCYSLSPLLQQKDLKDITRHSSFNVDFDEGKDASYFRMGAYKMGVNLKQKDYLLFSPELFKRINRGGLNRKGIFPSNKPQWPVYSSLTKKEHSASEHPFIWAELDI